jgi:hypothetical protein
MPKYFCSPGGTTLVEGRVDDGAASAVGAPGRQTAVAAGELTPAGQCAALLRTASGALGQVRIALARREAGEPPRVDARSALASAERALRIVAGARRTIIAPEVHATWKRLDAERAGLARRVEADVHRAKGLSNA